MYKVMQFNKDDGFENREVGGLVSLNIRMCRVLIRDEVFGVLFRFYFGVN